MCSTCCCPTSLATIAPRPRFSSTSVLWTKLYRSEQRSVALSLQQLGELAGLSKSAVQAAIRLLKRRGLIRITKNSQTASRNLS